MSGTTTRLGFRKPTSHSDVFKPQEDIANLADDVDAAQLVRSFGKSIIATTESRTNIAYGLLTTPDKVSVVLPTDGLILVACQATWKESTGDSGRAALFIGANQLKVAYRLGASPQAQAAALDSIGNVDRSLASFSGGLFSSDASSTAYAGDVTTGQAIGISETSPSAGTTNIQEINNSEVPAPAGAGGWCSIFAAAGTYDVSVQFKAATGSVTVKNRKLWVWTLEL